LAGGNFSGVLPYEGRNDATMTHPYTFNPELDIAGLFRVLLLRGEVRDIKHQNGKQAGLCLLLSTMVRLDFFTINN